MSWQRRFLAAAAVFNAGWAVAFLAVPERIFLSVPPRMDLLAALVAAEGLCFAVCAVRRVGWILDLSILGKALGPLVFVAAVLLGHLPWSSWWLTVVDDVAWIPPLLAVRRGALRW